MKAVDPRDLYRDTKLPPSTRPSIFRELLEGGECVAGGEPEAHGLPGEEDGSFVKAGPM